MNNLQGLIVGCGSIGERHLYNLKKLGVTNLAICDSSKKILDKLSKKYNVTPFKNFYSALLQNPTFTIISTYPSTHIELATDCIKANSHVFIEKPLSISINGIEKMLKMANAKKLQVAVGYNLRFDKSLNLLKTILQKNKIGSPLSISSKWGYHIRFWHPGKSFQNHYVLKSGGGIILDDSHEYDYLRWILQDEPVSVYCQTKKSSSIKTQTESIATLLIKFKKGTMANLQLDYIRPTYQRECEIIGEKGSLTWNFSPQKNHGTQYKNYATTKITLSSLTKINNSIINNRILINEMYINEMKNFIDSIMYGKKLIVDGHEGLKTLKIGLAAKTSALKNRVINL